MLYVAAVTEVVMTSNVTNFLKNVHLSVLVNVSSIVSESMFTYNDKNTLNDFIKIII